MDVTIEQRDALERGEPISVKVDAIGKEYILLEKCVYEQMRQLLKQQPTKMHPDDIEEIDRSFFEFDVS